MTDPAESAGEQLCFYENLYKNELGAGYEGESDFFDELPQVPEEANAKISGALSEAELYKALQGMESERLRELMVCQLSGIRLSGLN